MKIIGIAGKNDFGKDGKDIAVEFRFEDERDKQYDTKNGLAYVWIGGELDGEVNYSYQGDMETSSMFLEEEKSLLREYVVKN